MAAHQQRQSVNLCGIAAVNILYYYRAPNTRTITFRLLIIATLDNECFDSDTSLGNVGFSNNEESFQMLKPQRDGKPTLRNRSIISLCRLSFLLTRGCVDRSINEEIRTQNIPNMGVNFPVE